ncbi:unnamed protein product [Symbiodinium sp. CCMP2592]|nr:unnamed protein product [Symbiodinium sp. CCMP2592]
MIELHGRLTAIAKDASEMEKAKKLNWTDERGHWRVLKWDPQRQELQVDESKITVSTEDLLKQTVEMRKGVTEEALQRFRSYKKMTDQPVTEWMQFRLEISFRPLWRSSLEYTTDVGRSGGMASLRLSSSARKAPIQRLSRTGETWDVIRGASLSLSAILQLSLHNTSNLCYLNTAVLTLAWATSTHYTPVLMPWQRALGIIKLFRSHNLCNGDCSLGNGLSLADSMTFASSLHICCLGVSF